MSGRREASSLPANVVARLIILQEPVLGALAALLALARDIQTVADAARIAEERGWL